MSQVFGEEDSCAALVMPTADVVWPHSSEASSMSSGSTETDGLSDIRKLD